ncbi:hypothetical protein F5B20DRAFT_592674 [Whalleya microplaca]|nr:hypothetical protein F5B20DRAFT_592674 [Whalleya microplaca]
MASSIRTTDPREYEAFNQMFEKAMDHSPANEAKSTGKFAAKESFTSTEPTVSSLQGDPKRDEVDGPNTSSPDGFEPLAWKALREENTDSPKPEPSTQPEEPAEGPQLTFERRKIPTPSGQKAGELTKLIHASKNQRRTGIRFQVQDAINSSIGGNEPAAEHMPASKLRTAEASRRTTHSHSTRSRFSPENKITSPSYETDFYWFVYDNCSHF